MLAKVAIPKWFAACDDVKLKLPEQPLSSKRTWSKKKGSWQGLNLSKAILKPRLLTISAIAIVQIKARLHHHPFLP
jgi:hypothetical protein